MSFCVQIGCQFAAQSDLIAKRWNLDHWTFLKLFQCKSEISGRSILFCEMGVPGATQSDMLVSNFKYPQTWLWKCREFWDRNVDLVDNYYGCNHQFHLRWWIPLI